MNLRTELARVRGLGSAKDGTGHWWAQRLTAIALIPLTLWFVASVISLAGTDVNAVKAWIANPLVAVLLIVLIGATFHHAQLGMQVVIEDYVHTEWLKFASIVLIKFGAVLLAAIAGFSVLKIAFAG